MKSTLKKSSLIVLVFLVFVSCDFFDIPEESDLPIEEWEVDRVEYYRNLQYALVVFSGSTGTISEFSYFKDFDCKIPCYRSSLMVIPGVVFEFGVGGGFTSNSLEFYFESGTEITESTVATFYNEWFYKVDEGSSISSGREVVAKVRILTASMEVTIVE